jgi:hypothetical protein
MDRWRKAGLQVHPSLLFALIFGEYHEFLAAQLEADGVSAHDACKLAVQQHLRAMCENVRVPKLVIYQVSDIMGNQIRFQRTKGARPQRFLHSEGFLDAFLYFKFSSKSHGRNAELLDYWTEQNDSLKHKPHYK